MTSELRAHFTDGSDVEVRITFDERRVEVCADDEVTQTRYRLLFEECTKIGISYMFTDDEFGDPNNLTEGIQELPAETEGVRSFRVGFVDESVLRISCRRFSMAALEGRGWSFPTSAVGVGAQT